MYQVYKILGGASRHPKLFRQQMKLFRNGFRNDETFPKQNFNLMNFDFNSKRPHPQNVGYQRKFHIL